MTFEQVRESLLELVSSVEIVEDCNCDHCQPHRDYLGNNLRSFGADLERCHIENRMDSGEYIRSQTLVQYLFDAVGGGRDRIQMCNIINGWGNQATADVIITQQDVMAAYQNWSSNTSTSVRKEDGVKTDVRKAIGCALVGKKGTFGEWTALRETRPDLVLVMHNELAVIACDRGGWYGILTELDVDTIKELKRAVRDELGRIEWFKIPSHSLPKCKGNCYHTKVLSKCVTLAMKNKMVDEFSVEEDEDEE